MDHRINSPCFKYLCVYYMGMKEQMDNFGVFSFHHEFQGINFGYKAFMVNYYACVAVLEAPTLICAH